jgi:hypothetical protein
MAGLVHLLYGGAAAGGACGAEATRTAAERGAGIMTEAYRFSEELARHLGEAALPCPDEFRPTDSALTAHVPQVGKLRSDAMTMFAANRSVIVAAAMETLGDVLAPLTLWGGEARGAAASVVGAPEPRSSRDRMQATQPRATNLLQLYALVVQQAALAPAAVELARLTTAAFGLFIYLLPSVPHISRVYFPPYGHIPLPGFDPNDPLIQIPDWTPQTDPCRAREGWRAVCEVNLSRFAFIAEIEPTPRADGSSSDYPVCDAVLNASRAFLPPDRSSTTSTYSFGFATLLSASLLSPRVLQHHRLLNEQPPDRTSLARVHVGCVFGSPIATFEAVRVAVLSHAVNATGLTPRTLIRSGITYHLRRSGTYRHHPSTHLHAGDVHVAPTVPTLNALLVAMGLQGVATLAAARKGIEASPMADWPLAAVFATEGRRRVVSRIAGLPPGWADDVVAAAGPTMGAPRPPLPSLGDCLRYSNRVW